MVDRLGEFKEVLHASKYARTCHASLAVGLWSARVSSPVHGAATCRRAGGQHERQRQQLAAAAAAAARRRATTSGTSASPSLTSPAPLVRAPGWGLSPPRMCPAAATCPALTLGPALVMAPPALLQAYALRCRAAPSPTSLARPLAC